MPKGLSLWILDDASEGDGSPTIWDNVYTDDLSLYSDPSADLHHPRIPLPFTYHLLITNGNCYLPGSRDAPSSLEVAALCFLTYLNHNVMLYQEESDRENVTETMEKIPGYLWGGIVRGPKTSFSVYIGKFGDDGDPRDLDLQIVPDQEESEFVGSCGVFRS